MGVAKGHDTWRQSIWRKNCATQICRWLFPGLCVSRICNFQSAIAECVCDSSLSLSGPVVKSFKFFVSRPTLSMASAAGQRTAGKQAEKNIAAVISDDPEFYDSGSKGTLLWLSQCLLGRKHGCASNLRVLPPCLTRFALWTAGIPDDRPRVTGKPAPEVG